MQPDNILSHAPKVLSQEQRKLYFRDGYIVLDGYVGQDWLDRLWEVTNSFIDESRNYTSSDSKFDLDAGHTAGSPRLRRLTAPIDHHETYWEFASRGPIVDLRQDSDMGSSIP